MISAQAAGAIELRALELRAQQFILFENEPGKFQFESRLSPGELDVHVLVFLFASFPPKKSWNIQILWIKR